MPRSGPAKNSIVRIDKRTGDHTLVADEERLRRILGNCYISVDLAWDVLMDGDPIGTPGATYRVDGDWRHVTLLGEVTR